MNVLTNPTNPPKPPKDGAWDGSLKNLPPKGIAAAVLLAAVAVVVLIIVVSIGRNVTKDVQGYEGGDARVGSCGGTGQNVTDYQSGKRVQIYRCSILIADGSGNDGAGGWQDSCYTDVNGDVSLMNDCP